MPREFAQIWTSIWDNDAFLALSESAQRAFMLLCTQKDISAAGVLRLWIPRWVEMSPSSEADTLGQALKELEASRFIVLDWTSGELLVRSFIKWDRGFNNPKRKPVIRRARDEVRSNRIREYLTAEFQRYGLEDPPPTGGGTAIPGDSQSEPSHDDSDTPSDMASDTDADSLSGSPQAELDNSGFPQVDRLSGFDALSNGVVGTYVSREETANHNPQPVPPSAGDDEASPAETPEQAAQRVTRGYAERVRLCNFVGVKQLAKKAINADYAPDAVEAALHRLADDDRPVTADSLRIELNGGRSRLRAVSGNYRPWTNPPDDSVYDEELLP